MRLSHFERFRPHCIVCALSGRPAGPLAVGHVERDAPGAILEGALVCGSPRCRFEFPILEGVPILTTNPRATVAEFLSDLRARDDQSAWMESILGDCAGPDSRFASTRNHLSSYGRGHWGDLDPAAPLPRARTVLGVLDAGLGLLGEPPRGAWLDLGCSLGRGTFELAARTGELALGLDIHLAKLLVVQRLLRDGRVRHPRRITGVVFERADFAVDLPEAARVDVWAADAAALPFADGVAAGALSLHVLDSIHQPIAHLRELGRVIAPGGAAILASPYDWNATATPFEGWIGGHTQRAPHRGRSAGELARLLSADDRAGLGSGLAITAEVDDVSWPVDIHERAVMEYKVHVALARRAAAPAPAP